MTIKINGFITGVDVVDELSPHLPKTLTFEQAESLRRLEGQNRLVETFAEQLPAEPNGDQRFRVTVRFAAAALEVLQGDVLPRNDAA